MATVPTFTSNSRFQTQLNLPTSTSTPKPHPSNSTITTQELLDVKNTPSGDIPPPGFINSINELRSFSTALSAFISRYDELQNHINFIRSSIDSKLPNHLVGATSSNQSTLTHSLETVCDQSIINFTRVTVSEQNPKECVSDCDWRHAIGTTPESSNFSHNNEETNAWKETEETVSEICCDQATTAVPEVIVLEQNPNRTAADCQQVHENAEIDVFKTTEETVPEICCDEAITAVPEAIVLEQNPNRTAADCEQVHENAEIDVLKKPEETDVLKKTVAEICCDQTITAVPEDIVSEQNPNETASDCKQVRENARMPENLAEIDLLKKTEEIEKKTEETVPESCCDQTIIAVPEAMVSGENHNGMAGNCEQSHENVRTPERLKEIDVCKELEEIDTLKETVGTVPEAIVSGQNANEMAGNCKQSHENVRTPERLEEIDSLKKPEQTDFCKNPEEVNVLQNPEETYTSMNPEEIDTLKVPEGIDTLKKRIRKKATKTNTSKKSMISVLEFLCQSMNSKKVRKHVAKHISEMINLRHEIAKALKLANDPAKLVLDSIGRFYLQRSGHYRKGTVYNLEHQKAARLASVLILECFVMISSDDIEIAKQHQEHAAAEAVIWRKRMIKEGGLSHTEEVDARGLLLFISGFRIQDHVFTIQDITDLIRASNVKGIATALRRSVFLIPKIPEVIYLMLKNDVEVEAVDLAYTFGLEDMCHAHNILTTYLRKKLKDIQNGCSDQMLEAMKQQLFDLESVKKCMDSHNIDPSMLLPEFNMNEKIKNLEKEISEGKLIQKRKSSENLIHQERKRACFGHENVPHQQKHVFKKPDIVDVFMKPIEIDNSKKLEEIDEPKKLEEINLLKNPKEFDTSKKHVETDTLKKPEETDNLKKPEEPVPETSGDQTITIVPEAIVLELNPSGMTGNCEQSHENVRTPEIHEEIDILNKPERTGILNKPGGTDILNKPEQTDFCMNPEDDSLQKPDKIETSMNPEVIVRTPKILKEIDVLMKPEVISTSTKLEQTDILNKPEEIDILKKPEQTDFCKNPDKVDTLKVLEEIDTSKKHEETGICKKATKTEASNKSLISELVINCQSMCFKKLRKHVAAHISEMINIRHEIAKALKLAKDPAKLVLDSIRRCYLQYSAKYRKGSDQEHQNALRLASFLILECFVMIGSDGTEIAKQDQERAAAEAVIWRKRMIREGGLRPRDEADARGLLLLISGFGILDHVFTIQDITDLVRASNVKGIATALRRSVFLIPKIPEVFNLMVKNNLEVEAVDIAYALGLEDVCHPWNILTSYLRNKIKDIQNGSSLETLEAMKQQLCDLKSVKQCLESHNIDPSMLLPEFKINERIQNLEKDINEWNLIQKRKSSENPIHQEPKRACYGHENMPHQQQHADHYDMNPYSRTTPPSTRHFDRNLSNSYITNYSPPSVYNAPAMPVNIPGPCSNGLPRGFHGSYDHMVHPDNVQPYGWHGPYDQHYSRHGQTYDSQPYVRPQGWGPSSPEMLDTRPGFPGRHGPSSDLYGFADIVEKEFIR